MSPLQDGQIPIGGLLRSTYVDDQGEIGALLDYDELTDVPTFTLDGDVLLITKVPGQPNTTLRFVGAVQRPHQVLGIAVGDTQTFADADFGAIDTNPDDQIAIPTITGNQYLAIWYAADSLEINIIQVVGSRNNHRDEFGTPIALTVGVSPGFYIVSKNTVGESRNGDNLLAYNITGLSTFTRYAATRLQSEGNDFVAADFTGTNGVSSTSDILDTGAARVTTEPGVYHGYAVPVSTNDISGILWPGFSGQHDLDHITQHERQTGTIQIGGIDYKVWRSTLAYSPLFTLNSRIAQVPTL